MKKTTILWAFFLFNAVCSFAQADTISVKKEKKFDHYISVQINELTKQILSVNNSNIVNDNPYLLTYNINDRKTGWGLRAGIGFNYDATTTNFDPTNNGVQTSKVSDLKFRAGIEKAFKLSDKWSTGAGTDFVYKYNKDESSQRYQNSTYGYDSTSKINQYGFDVMGWVRYSFSKRILVGTEVSFYYVTGTLKGNITYLSQGQTGGDFDNKNKDSKLNLPVVFYLTVKL